MLVLENLIVKRLKSVLLVFVMLGLAGHTTAAGVQYDQAKLSEIGNKLDQLYYTLSLHDALPINRKSVV